MQNKCIHALFFVMTVLAVSGISESRSIRSEPKVECKFGFTKDMNGHIECWKGPGEECDVGRDRVYGKCASADGVALMCMSDYDLPPGMGYCNGCLNYEDSLDCFFNYGMDCFNGEKTETGSCRIPKS